MALNLSREQRDEMLRSWFDRIVGSYPDETGRFLREQSDPFANPVGTTLREELEPILDGVISGCDPTELEPGLDRIIRVRALQDMSPAAAVGFVLTLKEVFNDVVRDASNRSRTLFDTRIDAVLLVAFNVYSRCKKEVYDIRVKSIRNQSLKVMERLNSWYERRSGGTSKSV